MAYISSKDFKALLEEIVKMLEEVCKNLELR